MNCMIKHFDVLDSTNQYLIEHWQKLPSRTIVIADQQAKGRGKQGKCWYSKNTHNLYASILLKSEKDIEKSSPLLTMLLSLACCEVLDEYIAPLHLKPQMRWPNDVLINHRKIAGVLAECSWVNRKLDYVVLGIGLNLSLSSHEIDLIDQPVTSLNELLFYPVSKNDVLQKLISKFFRKYDSILKDNPGFLLTLFQQRLIPCKTSGQEISLWLDSIQKMAYHGNNNLLQESI